MPTLYKNCILTIFFNTDMRTDVITWHLRMKEDLLDVDNTDIIKWNLYNINYKYEHVRHRSLKKNNIYDQISDIDQ